MATYKTPDVYVEEIPSFPPSVVEVGTAIPAFIGYTQKAEDKLPNDLILKPTKVYSLKEYETHFGIQKDDAISITVTSGATPGVFTANAVTPADTPAAMNASYLLYYAVKMFFDNGGAQCYIVSVGIYQPTPVFDLTGDAGNDPTTSFGLQDGLDAVALEDEPTLIVIPEAVKATSGDYQTLVQAVLTQCGKLKDR